MVLKVVGAANMGLNGSKRDHATTARFRGLRIKQMCRKVAKRVFNSPHLHILKCRKTCQETRTLRPGLLALRAVRDSPGAARDPGRRRRALLFTDGVAGAGLPAAPA